MKTNCLIVVITLLIACQSGPSDEKASDEKAQINYYEHGNEITAIAQAELMKSVKEALQEGGPVHAIRYCNIHATPLSDSISKHFDCEIARVFIAHRGIVGKGVAENFQN